MDCKCKENLRIWTTSGGLGAIAGLSGHLIAWTCRKWPVWFWKSKSKSRLCCFHAFLLLKENNFFKRKNGKMRENVYWRFLEECGPEKATKFKIWNATELILETKIMFCLFLFWYFCFSETHSCKTRRPKRLFFTRWHAPEGGTRFRSRKHSGKLRVHLFVNNFKPED